MNKRLEDDQGTNDIDETLDQDDLGTNNDSDTSNDHADDDSTDAGKTNNKKVSDADLIIRRLKRDLNKTRSELKDIKSNQETTSRDKIKREGKLEVLVSTLERDLQTKQSEIADLKNAIERNAKFQALRSKAKKAGLLDSAEGDLESLDLEDLHYMENENGIGTVHGSESFLERLKKQKPHWFGTSKVDTSNSGARRKTTKVVDDNDTPEITPKLLGQLLREGKHKTYEKYLDIYLKNGGKKPS